MSFFYKLVLLILFIGFSSCVKDLDFDQAEDLVLEPAFEFSLLNFELDIEDFLAPDIIIDQDVMIESKELEELQLLPDFFNDAFIEEDLERIVFKFIVTNTSDQEFMLALNFLDENGDITYMIEPLIIPGNIEDDVLEREIILGNNPSFFSSVNSRAIVIYEGGVLNPFELNQETLTFNSSGEFFFNIN